MVAWCLLVLAIAVDDKVMIGCVDAGSSYSFSDCALAAKASVSKGVTPCVDILSVLQQAVTNE